MELDTERWAGDGEFTQVIIERLRAHPGIGALRVEDAPASREDTGYSFISNELFVCPAVGPHAAEVPRWSRSWWWRRTRRVSSPAVDLAAVEQWLSSDQAIGAPDFMDEGLLQYLRTQRIIPPYQTRGYKLVELVRIYLVPPTPR